MIASTNRFVLAAFAAAFAGCAAASVPAPTVKAGSMARFAAHEGFLYAIDGKHLRVYRARAVPELVAVVEVQEQPETVFPHGDLLFLGTRRGMLVYDVRAPQRPLRIGKAEHVYACDPVVVERGVAYVTVRSGGSCPRGENALLVFDVSDPTAPVELARHAMSSPHGLGVDDGTLFVADANEGLQVLDVRNPTEPRPVAALPGIAGYDVIAHAGVLYVVADEGLYQYRYGGTGLSDAPLSRIPIGTPRGAEL